MLSVNTGNPGIFGACLKIIERFPCGREVRYFMYGLRWWDNARRRWTSDRSRQDFLWNLRSMGKHNMSSLERMPVLLLGLCEQRLGFVWKVWRRHWVGWILVIPSDFVILWIPSVSSPVTWVICAYLAVITGLPRCSVVKNLPAMWVGILGLARSSGKENGNPLQYSCLENPMDRGAWWATVHGVAKSQIRLNG